MTIQIELTPEDEAMLRREAEARGEAPEAVAGEMLRALLHEENRSRAGILPMADGSPNAWRPPSIGRGKDWRRTVGAVDPNSAVERAFEAGRRFREAERGG